MNTKQNPLSVAQVLIVAIVYFVANITISYRLYHHDLRYIVFNPSIAAVSLAIALVVGLLVSLISAKITRGVSVPDQRALIIGGAAISLITFIAVFSYVYANGQLHF